MSGLAVGEECFGDGVGEVAFEYSECFDAARRRRQLVSLEQRFGGFVNADLG